MAKMLLLSVLLGAVIIPVLASRDRHPMRALKRMLVFSLVFNLLYAFGALVLYPPIALQ